MSLMSLRRGGRPRGPAAERDRPRHALRGAATLSVRLARKAHFEEVFGNTGLLLLLGGLLSGVLGVSAGSWLVTLLSVAGGVMGVAFGLGRSLYFAVGVAAAYLGLVRLLSSLRGRQATARAPRRRPPRIGGLALIFWAHRRMVER